MIKAVNFAVSNICSANCIYCPKDRGDNCSVSFMSLDTFESVVRNLNSSEFLANNKVRVVRLGENGDLFLNENAIGMLRIARKKFPYAAIEIYNHFYMMKPSICEVILKEKLVDSVFTNIDGIEDSYEKVKKINFNTTMNNLCYFIEERDSMNLLIPVTVKALTLRHYIDVVKTNFNTFPAYVSKELLKVSDDFLLIKKMFDKVLNKKMDKLIRSWVCMWGERENLSKEKQDRYACPMLFRNEREIFVAPDGRWYLCCMDSRQELVIGDLTKSKVCELVLSKKRSQHHCWLLFLSVVI